MYQKLQRFYSLKLRSPYNKNFKLAESLYRSSVKLQSLYIDQMLKVAESSYQGLYIKCLN